MNWLNQSIRNKFLAIILAGSIAIILALFASYNAANNGMNGLEKLIEKDIASERAVKLMLADFKTQVQEWKNTLLRGHDQGDREKYWKRFQEREADVQNEGQALLNMLSDPEVEAVIERFIRTHKTMGVSYRDGFNAFVAQNYDHKVGDRAVQGIDREPAKLLTQAAKMISDNVKARGSVAKQAAHFDLNMYTGIVVLVVLIYTIVSIVIINKAIVQPSRHLIESISRISEGKLGNDISIRRDDELGQLASASRRLQAFLVDLSDKLDVVDGDLRSASNELANSSDEMVRKIGTANDSTDHIASAMTEMSATAQEVAGHAASAANLAQEADTAAKDGVNTMSSAQASITQLAAQIADTVEVVKRLEDDTSNVGTVLSVIRGIAEQTNLLALNAAIEAARAGEQGRGFAVVADEVRSLAQKTQQSTAEIEDIIESVQTGAKNTAAVMNASSEVTASSADMFNQASNKLDVISSSISQINGLNMQVATAAEEQTMVSEDIAKTVVEMSDLVDATTSSANQNLALSQRLKDAAINLEQVSGTFQRS